MLSKNAKLLFQALPQSAQDAFFMSLALQEAQHAYALGEVPVGAVLVQQGRVIAQAHNTPITGCDPTAHAEMTVLRRAAKAVQNYRLVNTQLYVTLEPCTMCLGAIVHARIERLIFAAREPKAGRVCSHSLLADNCFNHRLSVTENILGAESSNLLQQFFAERRNAKRS